MARWLINRNDTQFAVSGLAELQELARAGKLGAGDMIQPPGATDWLYASEIDELHEALAASAALEAELGGVGRGKGSAGRMALGAVLLTVIAGGGWFLYDVSQRLPDPNARLLDQLSFSEIVVTEDGAPFLDGPEATAPKRASLAGGTVLELLAKRGDYYRARPRTGGAEGWVRADEVLPMYRMGGGTVIEKYDPLFNPDRYLEVMNASWMQLPDQKDSSLSVFQFMLRNTSRYDITDLKIVATIKDAKGHQLETVEFPVEGIVPAQGHTMVGTLAPEPRSDAPRRLVTKITLEQLSEADPNIVLRYSDGVEVEMQTVEFHEASIDIAELRAVPDGEAPSRG